MKRAFCIALVLLSMISVLVLPANAQIFSGLALDKVKIMEDYNKAVFGGGNLTAEEKKEIAESYGLAEHYKIQYEIDTTADTIRIFCGTDEQGNVVEQKMLPYAKREWVPWLNSPKQYSSIETVYVEQGVKSLGRYTFWGCTKLKTVYLSHSVEKVDRTALYQCENLETIYYQGNKADFQNRVNFDTVRNWTEDENGTILFTALEKIHYGESVTVQCVNQEGELITSYTVGGYFPGDEYTIVPKEYEGMTYTGKKSRIVGQFKEGDNTVYKLEYRCDHEYVISDPTKPCGSECKYCGGLDPACEDLHVWGETEVESERGFLTPLKQRTTCTVCGNERLDYKRPVGVIVGVAAAVAVIVGTGVAAVILLRKRQKRIKELTW